VIRVHYGMQSRGDDSGLKRLLGMADASSPTQTWNALLDSAVMIVMLYKCYFGI
jgi:hypothetical protein